MYHGTSFVDYLKIGESLVQGLDGVQSRLLHLSQLVGLECYLFAVRRPIFLEGTSVLETVDKRLGVSLDVKWISLL